ncbi:MAG TPA: hypothetical protein VM782_02540 [Stellaceae bacterium]|nr:hypothetical protein [Stellaceae bacterium]
MASPRRKAIHRRLDAIAEITARKVGHRERLRDRARAARTIRLAALRAGIDPARIRDLDNIAYTHDRLTRLGLTLEIARADTEFIAHDRQRVSRSNWAASVARRIPEFFRRPPHGRDASLDDWYAWALAQQRRRADPVHFRRDKPVVAHGEFSGHRWKKRLKRRTLNAALDRLNRERRNGGAVSRFATWLRSLR